MIDEAVLAQSRRMLAEVGYEAFSMAAVAAAAGTTRQALYRRFSSKADLATAAVASMAVEGGRVDTADPFADLVQELRHFQRGVSRPNGVSLIGTMLLSSADPELVDLFRTRLVHPRRARLRHILQRGAQAGFLEAADADLDVAVSFLTGSFYALALSGTAPGRDWPKRVASLVWRSIEKR